MKTLINSQLKESDIRKTTWTCFRCTFENSADRTMCEMCDTERLTGNSVWNCGMCTFENTSGTTCAMCETARTTSNVLNIGRTGRRSSVERTSAEGHLMVPFIPEHMTEEITSLPSSSSDQTEYFELFEN
eukprot:UN33916